MSLFDSFRTGLTKTRELIASGLNRMAAGLGIFDDDMLDELEMMLVQADCGVTASSEAIDAVRDYIRRTGDASRAGVLGQLRETLAGMIQERKLTIEPQGLNVFLLVGVNGTGKTTTAAKLAQRAKDDGHRVIMAAADTFRAAAVEQLKTWGERTQTAVIAHATGADPAAVVFDAISAARARKADLLLVDTAGRLHTKKNLMAELEKIRRVIDREAADARVETILVIDATTGQNAIVQARAFHQAIEVTGLAITKLDGSAKGGVAIAVARETGLPLSLAGLGEGAHDLQDFDRTLFLQALLPEA